MNGFGTSPLELMACDAMLQGLAFLDEFTYSATWLTATTTALGANATVDVQIQINGDSDFVAQEYNLTGWSAVNTIVAAPDLLISIVRSGSGREIMNQEQHVANICGGYFSTRSEPGRLPCSSLYQSQNTIRVRLQDRSGVAWNRVDFAMRGFKVFYQTNAQGQTGTRQGIFHAL